jgi:hypothetical protein
METLRSSEPSVLTRTTLCNIPEGSILHSHRSEILKSYTNIRKVGAETLIAMVLKSTSSDVYRRVVG